MADIGNIKYIYQAKKTVAEMLIDRGYSNNKTILEMFELDFENFKGKYDLKNPILELKNDLDNEITILSFKIAGLGEKGGKFKKDDLMNIYNYAIKINEETQKKIVIMIVFTLKITPNIQKERQLLNEKSKRDNKSIFIEFWNAEHLQYNISKSNLVPKHSIMSPTEIEELKNEYQIKNLYELPRIKINDPMIRYLGARHGDVIKIKRTSETTGYTNFYRLVS